MSSQFILDKNYKLRKVRTSVGAVLRGILMFFIATISMAVLYYIIFALVFSTDTERRLKQENKMYAKEFPELERKQRLLEDVVEGLRIKDDRIYEEIFHTSAPDLDPVSSISYLMGLDSIPDTDIVLYSDTKLRSMRQRSSVVEDNFRRIYELVEEKGFVMPPMHNPLKNYSIAQTGASIGDKINPFYKVKIRHDGLDLIAHSGEPVYSVADGIVREVVKSRKGLGNQVVIDHGNGYRTRYAHLADVEVAKGRRVRRGTRLGYVGVSGNSFAPHLHYEVWKDTVALDPVNHFFASLSPEDYVSMLVMSVSTGQSMD